MLAAVTPAAVTLAAVMLAAVTLAAVTLAVQAVHGVADSATLWTSAAWGGAIVHCYVSKKLFRQ